MTFEDWCETYQCEKNNLTLEERPYDQTLFETYGPELEYIRGLQEREPKRIWTLIQDEGLHIVAGWHFVNREGYFVTGLPWSDETLTIQLD